MTSTLKNEKGKNDMLVQTENIVISNEHLNPACNNQH